MKLIVNLINQWLIRTRSKSSRTNKSRAPESHSVEPLSNPSNKSQTALLETLRLQESRSEARSDCPTSTSEFAVEELPAVKVQRPGTTGKWLSSSDTSIWNALQPKWRKLPQSPFQTELKSTSISEAQHDKCPASKKPNDPPHFNPNIFFFDVK